MNNYKDKEKKVIDSFDEDNPVFSDSLKKFFYSMEDLKEEIKSDMNYTDQSILRLYETKPIFLEEINPYDMFQDECPEDQCFHDFANEDLIEAFEKLNEVIRNHPSVGHCSTDQAIFISGIE